MGWKGNDYQHTRSEAYSADTYDLYGQEHDEAMQTLVDLENGVRKHFADALRERAEVCPQDERAGMLRAADLLDPYTEKHPIRAAGFTRTTLEGDEGAKQPYPPHI